MSGSIFDWMEVFDSPNARDVEIIPANGRLINGTMRWRLSINTRGVELHKVLKRNGSDDISEITLLLPGNTPEIYPGDRINYDNNSCEIASVELCRSFSGEVIARRCKIK